MPRAKRKYNSQLNEGLVFPFGPTQDAIAAIVQQVVSQSIEPVAKSLLSIRAQLSLVMPALVSQQKTLEKIMATLADLSAAIDMLATSASTVEADLLLLHTELTNAIANQTDPATLQTMVDKIVGISKALGSAADAAVPPAPAPAAPAAPVAADAAVPPAPAAPAA